MKIKQQFISRDRKKQRSGIKMTPKYITIHSTGNERSTAQNEADFVCYNSNRQASYHFVVDDHNIIQVLPTNEVSWNAGDGHGNGNYKSIAIEICESGDRKKAVDNALELTRYLMDIHDIGVKNVRRHYDWSKKNCPRILIDKSFIKDGIDWKYFIRNLEVDDVTEERVREIINEVLHSNDQVSESLSDEWNDGVTRKITDGTRPRGYATREQVVAMIVRALKE